MVRIIYISRANFLSGRTNVYNLTKTCEMLNQQKDFKVNLVTTDQQRDIDAFFYRMGVRQPFEVTCLGITNTSSVYGGSWWHEPLMFFFSNFYLALFLLWRVRRFDVLYFRDESFFPLAWWVKILLRKRVFFETHSVLQSKHRQMMNLIVIRLAHGVIAISSGLKHFYQKTNNNILLSLCSAAEDLWFDHSQSKDTLRKQLGLPIDAFLAGYTGMVGVNPNNDYYEVDDIVRSLPSLPNKIIYVIVGEINGNAQWLRKIALENGVQERVIIVPWQERSRIPKYLQAFDAVLIPKRKKDLVGDSPAKMFPALASRRPIIGGRTECIEEVLTDDVDAVIVERNNPEGWAEAIKKIYENNNLARKLSDQAWITKDKYTWEKRGVAIAQFIKNLTN